MLSARLSEVFERESIRGGVRFKFKAVQIERKISYLSHVRQRRSLP